MKAGLDYNIDRFSLHLNRHMHSFSILIEMAATTQSSMTYMAKVKHGLYYHITFGSEKRDRSFEKSSTFWKFWFAGFRGWKLFEMLTQGMLL